MIKFCILFKILKRNFKIRETLVDSSFLVLFGLKNRVGRSVENKKKGSKKFFFPAIVWRNMGRSGPRNLTYTDKKCKWISIALNMKLYCWLQDKQVSFPPLLPMWSQELISYCGKFACKHNHADLMTLWSIQKYSWHHLYQVHLKSLVKDRRFLIKLFL